MKIINLTFVLFLLLGVSFSSNAQITNKGYLDAAVGAGQTFSAAISYYRLHPVALKKKFYLGYGLRFTSQFSNEGEYITAPANVSEGNFFKPQNKAKLDTLTVQTPNINSLNLAIYLGYNFNEKLSVGFNIDAIGFSFGRGDKTASFVSREGTDEGFRNPSTEVADVSPFNLLLTGDYDLGSLNSEFYAKYQFNEKWGLRGGINFIFGEYTTQRELAFENDRFRQKALGVMLGVSYKL